MSVKDKIYFRLQGGGSIVFIELSDGSSTTNIQVVVDKTMPNFEEISKCGVACSFKIVGTFVKSPGKGQLIEIACKDPAIHSVKIYGVTDQGSYPLAKKHHKPETLREIAHLRPRSNLIGAMSRVRNNLALATHLFFQSRGFLYVHTPIITASDCEGAGEMFQVTTVLPSKEKTKDQIPAVKDKNTIDYEKDFFKKPAYLTVSGQLAVENYACALSNVYTFGPTFRAEVSHTSRHLSEFWMIEPEMAFADIHDNMGIAEDYLKFLITYSLENNMPELEFFDKRVKKGIIEYLQSIQSAKFARMTYNEIIDALLEAEKGGKKFENKVEWGIDLNSEHERYIAEELVKGPVIAYNYPKDIKSFYMKENDDGKTCASMDVLVPQIGEIIGGSQREDILEVLEKKIETLGLDKESYWWYLELRKYGTVPHSGFGLGFERVIMMVTGIQNIRDVIPYPRFPGNAEF